MRSQIALLARLLILGSFGDPYLPPWWNRARVISNEKESNLVCDSEILRGRERGTRTNVGWNSRTRGGEEISDKKLNKFWLAMITQSLALEIEDVIDDPTGRSRLSRHGNLEYLRRTRHDKR